MVTQESFCSAFSFSMRLLDWPPLWCASSRAPPDVHHRAGQHHINRMLKEVALHKLFCVVVDELHMVRCQISSHVLLMGSQALERSAQLRRATR